MDRRKCETTVIVSRAGTEVATWEILRQGRADLGLVNTLARLQLLAHRMGCTIEIREPSEELTGLLDLTGLAEVLGPPGCYGSRCSGRPKVANNLVSRKL